MTDIRFTNDRPYAKFLTAINLLPYEVALYDAIGNIAICDKGCHIDLFPKLSRDVMVIVDNDSDIKAYDIPEENAVMTETLQPSIGRSELPVFRIVRPYDDAVVTLVPPKNAPEVYHV